MKGYAADVRIPWAIGFALQTERTPGLDLGPVVVPDVWPWRRKRLRARLRSGLRCRRRPDDEYASADGARGLDSTCPVGNELRLRRIGAGSGPPVTHAAIPGREPGVA